MKKIGLVLAGGGGRGAYQIGVWKALRETGLDNYITAVSGSSVGGLNAALFVQKDLEKAQHIWESISMKKILTPKSESRHARSALFERDGLEKIIDEGLDMRCFDNSDHNCWMTCVRTTGPDNKGEEIEYAAVHGKKVVRKYSRGRVEYFNLKYVDDDYTRKRIILGTSAMPFVFPGEMIGGEVYLDGGARILGGDNVPVAPLYVVDKCDIILIVYLTTIGTDKRIDESKYPNVKLFEVFPQENLGKVPGIDGMFDFTPKGAVKRMQQGYDDVIEMFRSIKGTIDIGEKGKFQGKFDMEEEVKAWRIVEQWENMLKKQ